MDIRPRVVEIYASAECMIRGILIDRGADRQQRLNALQQFRQAVYRPHSLGADQVDCSVF